MTFRSFVPASLWFLISTFLLVIPGNDLPQTPLVNIPYFDKYVHTIMFFLLTSLFSLPFRESGFTREEVKSWFISIMLYAIGFGITIEFVQKYLVPNRSFDVGDILCDTIGASVGTIATWNLYKKIGPDRNRGRNQN
jgi:VanZ family protein